jgi:glycosyltransferase involved in cell wall biosynthesis
MELSVAAVVPLFNGARWIRDCLESIQAQTCAPSEIIVIDDGSTDNGAAIVRALAHNDGRIRLLQRANEGQSSARNAGVQASSSTLIAFLDQDDLWYSDHLAALLVPFRKNQSLGWCYSDLDAIDENGTITKRAVLANRKMSGPKRSIADCVARDMHVLPSATLISRTVFEKLGGFDERLSGYEDDDLFLRLLAAGYGNAYVDKPLSKWRFHPRQTSYTHSMTASRLIYFEKLLAAYPTLSHVYSLRFAPLFWGQFRQAIRTGDEVEKNEALAGIQLALPLIRSPKGALLRVAFTLLRAAPRSEIIFRLAPVALKRFLLKQ